MKYIATIEDKEYVIEINRAGEVMVNGKPHIADMQSIGRSRLFSLLVDGRSYDVYIDEQEERFLLVMQEGIFEVKVEDERTRRLAGLQRVPVAPVGEILIKAPMPGVVVDVLVVGGQEVAAGERVIVLESMKMQNEFKSPRGGTVRSVRVKVGDRVEQNQILITIS
ncbi:MAG: biotin/lipoyl-containing protein [Anaerolineae bacterium]